MRRSGRGAQVGRHDARSQGRLGGGPPDRGGAGTGVSAPLDQLIRSRWWAAVATLCRLTGDLEAAEDAVQEACVVALERWPSAGVPDNALGWLIGVARHKALDRLRREAVRMTKEAASMREAHESGAEQDASPRPADTLSLMFMCCHPALSFEARVALT